MTNITDANGNTAVSEAGAGGQPEVITLLVERGADVNTQVRAPRHTFTRGEGQLWNCFRQWCMGMDVRRVRLDGHPSLGLPLGVTLRQCKPFCSWGRTQESTQMMAAPRCRWALMCLVCVAYFTLFCALTACFRLNLCVYIEGGIWWGLGINPRRLGPEHHWLHAKKDEGKTTEEHWGGAKVEGGRDWLVRDTTHFHLNSTHADPFRI